MTGAAQILTDLREVAQEAQRLAESARVIYGVPLRMYDGLRGKAWHPGDLVAAEVVYPFDALEVRFDIAPTLRAQSKATLNSDAKLTRLLYHAARVEGGAIVQHTVYGESEATTGPAKGYRAWAVRRIVVDVTTGEVRWSTDDPDGPGGIIMPRSGAALFWAGLVSLSVAITRCSTTIDVTRVSEATREPYASRQQRRDAERSGAREAYVVRLRPGTTLRKALREVAAARKEVVRSRPRRHVVTAHTHRYHTRAGIVTRMVRSFIRGGHLGGDVRSVYDARRLEV